jgi:hypothetical protein
MHVSNIFFYCIGKKKTKHCPSRNALNRVLTQSRAHAIATIDIEKWNENSRRPRDTRAAAVLM